MPQLPLIIDRLDNEPQSWAHGVDILAHDLLDYGCFAGIVQSSASLSANGLRVDVSPYSIKIRISLSLSLAFRNIDSILLTFRVELVAKGRQKLSGRLVQTVLSRDEF